MTTTELQLWQEDEPAALVAMSEPTRALVELAVLEERAQRYGVDSKSANTWRAYKSDLKHFGAWCDARGLVSLPAEPDTVKLYLVDHGGVLAMSTLRRRLAAISEVHNAREFDNPTRSPEVQFVWKGMLNTHSTAPRSKEGGGDRGGGHARQAACVVTHRPARSRRRAHRLRRRHAAVRDRRARRRRRHRDREGLRVRVTRSKTDQEGAGDTIGITYGSNPPTCPVRAWRSWVEASRVDAGAAFRRVRNGRVTSERLEGRNIARMVQRRAQAAGLAPELFGGHSLRSGFATTAARAGMAEHKIMRQGRWTTSKSMRGYIQEGELFIDNPSAKLGL